MKKTDNEKIQRLDVSQTHIDHFAKSKAKNVANACLIIACMKILKKK